MTKKKTLVYTVEPMNIVAIKLTQSAKKSAVTAYKKAIEKNGNLCHKGEQYTMAKWALTCAIEAEEVAFEMQRTFNRVRDAQSGRFYDVPVSEKVRLLNWDMLIGNLQLVKESVAAVYKVERQSKKNKKAKAA